MCVAVAACDSAPAYHLGLPAPKDCPPDPTPVSLGGGWYRVDSLKLHYVDIVIDGVVARRNIPSKSSEPLNIPGFPEQAEIKNITLASYHMSHDEVTKRYGTCPGMDAWLYETKAGQWRPVDVSDPLGNVPTAPTRRVP